MAKDNVIVLRGELHWAKVIGKARPHTGNPKYDKGPYWSLDLTPNAASRKLMEKHGITEKLREPTSEKDDRKETFLSLRVLENKSNGEKNDPPRVYDVQGKPWGTNLIGNGSIGDVKVKIVDYGKGVQKGVYLQALRVLDLVPYESTEFEPLDEDDEFFAKPAEGVEVGPNGEDLEDTLVSDDPEDDVPF